MEFEARDLMIDVFPDGAERALQMVVCTPASPFNLPEEEVPCEPPSCEGSAPPEEPEEPGEPADDPAGGSGLATLRRELRATLAAETGAAG
jgi:hypothetical protein